MLTNKITGFSADLLNTVRGILGEAKKCPGDCECQKCEAEKMEEGYASAAQRKAVWANRADDGAGHPDKKKLKEEILEMVNEASDGLADKAKKSGVSLSTLKKVYARGIAAWNSGHRPGTTPQQWAHARVNSYITKGKGTYHGADKDLRSEGADVPFEGPYDKPRVRKDKYGNVIKNVAKHLAKKAMNDLTKKNEEAEHNNCGTPECCGQCDTPTQIDETAKIVAHLQKRYGDNIRKSHVRSAASDFGVDASKLAKAVRTKLGKNMLDEEDDGWYTHSQMHGSKKSEKHPKGISAAEWKSGIRWHHGKNKRINIKEEAEQIDEISKATMGRYINKAKDSIDMASYRQGHKEAHGSSSKPLEKKLTKRHKGISTAVNKLTKEEAEQIDELSKGTMGRYINKAATKMGSQGVTAGLKIAADEKSSKNFKDMGKREKGIKLAVSKLTKEEQDFVDSLNDETFEEVEITEALTRVTSGNKGHGYHGTVEARDEAERDKRYSAMHRYAKQLVSAAGHLQDAKKPNVMVKHFLDSPHGRHIADNPTVKNITSRFAGFKKIYDSSMHEEVEITEARGRPRKAGAKDFTIHPKTKEKLMHNNPEHMKKIEVLQKNGILEKPKVEAGQHIMNQLSKAKTSMLGGSTIHFTHGDSKHVSGTHAAKLLTKYAGMKPNEKEDFQKFVGHSHENLMKHV
jgi:hypothetical protein